MSCYENVESPRSYDFWAAVWLVSNTIGRRITVARPHAPVYLNVYAVLCAEAGITRKSSVVRAATSLLDQYCQEDGSQLDTLSGGITAEKLSASLVKQTALWGHSHLALSSSELVSLLGRDRYSSGLVGRLTDLYDSPTIHTRSNISDGHTTARNVYVTLLGASTPSWLARAVSPDVVEGGFTSRCLFIIEDKPKRLIAWPEETKNVSGIHRRLLEGMSNLRDSAIYAAKRAGGIRLTRVARQQFTHWYESRVIANDAYGASFQAREDHHILRLCGILAAADGSWEINEHHVTHATSVIQYVKHSGSALFGTGVESNRTYALVDRIRGALVSAGRSGLSQTALSSICRRHGSPEDQRLVLQIMHEMQLIQVFSVETGERGRPTTMYRAVRSLTSPRAIETVVDMLIPQEDK